MPDNYFTLIEPFFQEVYYIQNREKNKITLKFEKNQIDLLNNEVVTILAEKLPKNTIIEIIKAPQNELARFAMLINFNFDSSQFKINFDTRGTEKSIEKLTDTISIVWYKCSYKSGFSANGIFATTIIDQAYGYIIVP